MKEKSSSESIPSVLIITPPVLICDGGAVGAWGGGSSSRREWGCWGDPPPSPPSAAWGMLFFCPLSPMCRRPLGRVCFACKAGCRCCPPKQGTVRDKGEAEHREGPTAVPPAWPHFFFSFPSSAAPLITPGLSHLPSPRAQEKKQSSSQISLSRKHHKTYVW